MAHNLIDLMLWGERTLAVYVLETEDGPALFDSGPTTSIPALQAGLAALGFDLNEIRHLLLSHIHLDHAGAAGSLVREHPRLQVHVSEFGARHLADPTRLEASARRLYGDSFDELWGAVIPVPPQNIHPVADRVAGLDCFPTPGHARHHVSYLDSDGTLYVGDAVGVRIQPGRFIVPHAPPPDIDLQAWNRTFDEIERRGPVRLALNHFGVAGDPREHVDRMREALRLWSERARDAESSAEFVAAAWHDLCASDPESASRYVAPAPLEQSYAGLRRYFDKQVG